MLNPELALNTNAMVKSYGFEWWVDNRGTGQLPEGEKRWPRGRIPILYAHFRIKAAKFKSCRRYPDNPPQLTPRQLVYIGEREKAMNFVTGPKNYGWLNSDDLRNSWFYTVYWELLPDIFAGANLRKTLEATVYFEVAQRHQNCPALSQNGGMQFTKALIHARELLVCKYEILRCLAALGI